MTITSPFLSITAFGNITSWLYIGLSICYVIVFLGIHAWTEFRGKIEENGAQNRLIIHSLSKCHLNDIYAGNNFAINHLIINWYDMKLAERKEREKYENRFPQVSQKAAT